MSIPRITKEYTNKPAFTLLELILVVASIAILATIVIIAINPAENFATSRNSQRASDTNVILNALSQYALDHNNQFPTGVTENLQMIGSATSGCNVACGEQLVAFDLPETNLANGLLNNIEAATPSPTATSSASPAPLTSGWFSPDSTQTPTGQWSNAAGSIDNNSGTYATNSYGGTGLGQYIYFTFNKPIYSNRFRLVADYNDKDITNIQVDVNVNGSWSTAFSGGNEANWNAKWAEATFPVGQVTQARFRYNYKAGGFYYWLYEFQLYKTTPTIKLPQLTTLNASLIQDVSATVHGDITDDGGEPSSYRFAYGPTTSYGSTTEWFPDGTSGNSYEAFINGLIPSSTYHFRIEAQNSKGISYGQDVTFDTKLPAVGDLPPGGSSDPDNKWQNAINATDGNNNTYAASYHGIGENQWSSYLYFTQAESFTNGISFYARGQAEVDQVQVDILKNGNWVTVLNGNFTGYSKVNVSFEQQLLSQTRIRFHATTSNTGFFWQLHEFTFRKSSEATSGTCINLASLVPNYVFDIPYDPLNGSSDKTYYAVKKLSNLPRVVVYSCTPELGSQIIRQR